MVVGEERLADVLAGAAGAEVAGHGRDGVVEVVGVAALAEGGPGGGQELAVADGAGGGGGHVRAEAGLDAGDAGQDGPVEAAAGAGGCLLHDGELVGRDVGIPGR